MDDGSDDPVIDEAKRIDDSLSKAFGLGEPSKERGEAREAERAVEAQFASEFEEGPEPTTPRTGGPARRPSKRRRFSATQFANEWLPPILSDAGLLG